jgi:hypothetical protein
MEKRNGTLRERFFHFSTNDALVAATCIRDSIYFSSFFVVLFSCELNVLLRCASFVVQY